MLYEYGVPSGNERGNTLIACRRQQTAYPYCTYASIGGTLIPLLDQSVALNFKILTKAGDLNSFQLIRSSAGDNNTLNTTDNDQHGLDIRSLNRLSSNQALAVYDLHYSLLLFLSPSVGRIYLYWSCS